MRIIEYFIQGKENNPSTCEDGLFIGKDIVAIIDGVTAKGKQLLDNKKSGCYAKDIILEFLARDVSKYTATELLERLDRLLRKKISDNPIQLVPLDYPRASLIVYNDFYQEIWSYGDCQCRINDHVYTHAKKIDQLNSALRSFYIEHAFIEGKTIHELKKNDPGRKQIQKNLLMQFDFENRENYFGYPVLNGQGICKSMINKYSVRKGDEIILASDGYPILKRTLQESEQILADILDQDPMCYKIYRTTKGIQNGNISFDDRSFCRLVV